MHCVFWRGKKWMFCDTYYLPLLSRKHHFVIVLYRFLLFIPIICYRWMLTWHVVPQWFGLWSVLGSALIMTVSLLTILRIFFSFYLAWNTFSVNLLYAMYFSHQVCFISFRIATSILSFSSPVWQVLIKLFMWEPK